MNENGNQGCTPDMCDSCTGCGGGIDKITLKVEWRHRDTPEEQVKEISENIFALSEELAVSGVELIYINNTFSPDISPGSSLFLINDRPLETLTECPAKGGVTREVIRKGIFQALLQNI